MYAYPSRNNVIYRVTIDNIRESPGTTFAYQMTDEICPCESKRRVHNFITGRNIENAEH